MWGLIVGIALGGLLLMMAVSSLRSGEIRLGDRVHRRGEPRYVLAVGVMAGGGILAAGSAVAAGISAEEPETEAIDVPGFALEVRGEWSEREAFGGAPAERDLGVVSYAGPDGELMITWRRAVADSSPEELLASLQQPGLRYDRWEPTAVDGVAGIDMEYATPRGVVRARALALTEADGELSWVLASCTHEGRGAACEDAVTSLRPTGSRPAR
ncbi:MAG: hypothetical protein RIF41_01485 [Polyangiaceae bacterium]